MSSGMYVTIDINPMIEAAARARAQAREAQERAREKSDQARLVFQQAQQQAQVMKARLASIQALRSTLPLHGEEQKLPVTQIHHIKAQASQEIISQGVDEAALHSRKVQGSDDRRQLETVDFSAALQQQQISPDQKKKEEISQKIADQLSQEGITALAASDRKANQLYEQFVAYVNEMQQDADVDAAFFEKNVTLRLSRLRQNMAERRAAMHAEAVRLQDAAQQSHTLTEAQIRKFEQMQEDYLALCSLTGQEVRYISSLEELQKEVTRVREMQRRKAVDEIVMENLRDVYHELGMEIGEEAVLDGMQGRRIHLDDEEDISVFMATSGDGILFETVAQVEEKETLSQNQRARVEEKAHSICKKHQKVIAMMKERGITLSVQALEEPRYEQIRRTRKRRDERRAGNTDGTKKTMADE